MEDIIRRIISVENKAQGVFADAKKAEAEFNARIDEDAYNLSRKISGRATDKCTQIKAIEAKAADEKISRILAKSEAQMKEIEDKYKENKDKWVDDIVKRITEQ